MSNPSLFDVLAAPDCGAPPCPTCSGDPLAVPNCLTCGGSGNHPGACRVPTPAEQAALARDFPQYVRPVAFDEE